MMRKFGTMAWVLFVFVPIVVSGVFADYRGRSGRAPSRALNSTAPTRPIARAAGQIIDRAITIDRMSKTIGGMTADNLLGFGIDGQPATVPGPVIYARVGDTLRLRVTNNIPVNDLDAPLMVRQDAISVHWHGIELGNESDGTAVTENPFFTGETRTYVFRTPRPGIYWFHPHVFVSDHLFQGLYGTIIVTDEHDDRLTAMGILPDNVMDVTLSDMTLEDPDGDGTFEVPGMFPFGCEFPNCNVPIGELPLVNGELAGGRNETAAHTVRLPRGSGLRLRLVNSAIQRFFRLRLLQGSEKPPSDEQISVSSSAFGDPDIDPLNVDQGLDLYRIGGEGGLLEHVRVEGDVHRCLRSSGEIEDCEPDDPDRIYTNVINKGEIIMSPANRADLVLVPRDDHGELLEVGESMTLWSVDFAHGRHHNRDIRSYKLITIQIVDNPVESAFDMREDDPLLAVLGVTQEDLQSIDPVDLDALAPVPHPDELPLHPTRGERYRPRSGLVHGSERARISFSHQEGRGEDGTQGPVSGPNIDGVRGEEKIHCTAESGGAFDCEDFLTHETLETTRFARVGDVLELRYRNATRGPAFHPFHIHGFSFQPVRMIQEQFDDSGNYTGDIELMRFDYREFIDTILINPGDTLVFRVRLFDREILPDHILGDERTLDAQTVERATIDRGGAIGRWLFHCHVAHHAALGMISDLFVLPEERINGVPEIRCEAPSAENDPGECGATVDCESIASCVDPDDDPTTQSCEPFSPYGVGVTEVRTDCSDKFDETSASCTVTVDDTEPPTVTCSATPTNGDDERGDRGAGEYRIGFDATDNCDRIQELRAAIRLDAGGDDERADDSDTCGEIPIASGQTIRLKCAGRRCHDTDDESDDESADGRLEIRAGGATLAVTATDESGNTAICEVSLCEGSGRRP